MARKRIVDETALVVANDSAPTVSRDTEKRTAKDLDEAVTRCREAETRAAGGIIALGRELGRIRDERLYVLRLGKAGTPRHRSWADFVRNELEMNRATADNLIIVAARFSEGQVAKFGVSKLRLLASAPTLDEPRLMARIEEGATKRQLRAEVQIAKAETGYQLPAKSGKAMPHHAGKPKKAKAEPVAQIDTRTVAMFTETIPANAQLPELLKSAPKTDAVANDEQLDDLHRQVMRLANDWKGKTYAPVVAVLRKIVETLEARDRAKEQAR